MLKIKASWRKEDRWNCHSFGACSSVVSYLKHWICCSKQLSTKVNGQPDFALLEIAVCCSTTFCHVLWKKCPGDSPNLFYCLVLSKPFWSRASFPDPQSELFRHELTQALMDSHPQTWVLYVKFRVGGDWSKGSPLWISKILWLLCEIWQYTLYQMTYGWKWHIKFYLLEFNQLSLAGVTSYFGSLVGAYLKMLDLMAGSWLAKGYFSEHAT